MDNKTENLTFKDITIIRQNAMSHATKLAELRQDKGELITLTSIFSDAEKIEQWVTRR